MKNEKKICKSCNAINSIIEDHKMGQLVCEECGDVYEEEVIADEYEGRTFQNDNGENQIQRVEQAMDPTMGNEMGTTLIIREKGKTRIVRNYSKCDKIQRNWKKIQNFLKNGEVAQNIIEETKAIYEKLAKNKNMQGRNIKHIILGIYFYVCRKLKMAKTIKEISDKFNVTERIIKRAFNNIKYDIVEPQADITEMIEAEKNFIRNFILENGLNFYVNNLSSNIIENMSKNCILEGKSPRTVAGMALFISCILLNEKIPNMNVFYQKFSNKNTLKKSYEEIKNVLNQIIPNNYSEKVELVLKDNIFP